MILLLNGTINAGKSTIAKAIQAQLTTVAHVEVDALHHFTPWIPHSESIPAILENVVLITKNYVRSGFRVIITWPLSRADYDYLVDQLANLSVPVTAITLCPGLEKALTNRGTRELNDWEMNRLPQMYSEGLAAPNFSLVIDNSNQTIDETVRMVVEKAGWEFC